MVVRKCIIADPGIVNFGKTMTFRVYLIHDTTGIKEEWGQWYFKRPIWHAESDGFRILPTIPKAISSAIQIFCCENGFTMAIYEPLNASEIRLDCFRPYAGSGNLRELAGRLCLRLNQIIDSSEGR